MPVIVIGAPRSGTKMLRELLKLHPDVIGTLYEQERVWSYGNLEKRGKAIRPDDSTPDIKKYITDHFRKYKADNPGMTIVDKNVVNTMRVEFIRHIFPEAPIVHILRDGRNAVCSARVRWQKPLDYKYIFENKILKNRAFPLYEIPFFVQRELRFILGKLLSRKRHVKWWGPKFDDTEALSEKYSLIELCGIQWFRCVEEAIAGLKKLESKSYFSIKYEDLVLNPLQSMQELFDFIKLSCDDNLGKAVVRYIKPSNISRWEQDISPEEYTLLINIIGKTLVKTGYIDKL